MQEVSLSSAVLYVMVAIGLIIILLASRMKGKDD